MMYGSSEIGDSEDDSSGGGGGGDEVCKDNRKELVLVLLLNFYSELEAISVSASRLSSYLTLYYLLTTYTIDYCFNKDVNNFDLRILFYSKQDL